MADSLILDSNDVMEANEEITESRENNYSPVEIQHFLNSDIDSSNIVETNSNKRGRDEDLNDEEEWQVVTGKKTKKKSLEDIQLSVTSKEKFPKQFALAKLMKANNISGIMRIKFINPFKLFINFRSEECAQTFAECEEFKRLGWRAQKTWEVGISYGLLRDIDVDLKEEELMNIIKSTSEVVSIKRLNRRSENGWLPCESVRIGFLGSNLPSYIYLYDLRVKVDKYVFPVTQCTHCWRFGHVKNLCPSTKPICPKCSERHENCDTMSFKCANCGGKHMAIAKICHTYIKEKKIRQLMSEFNVTYRKAVTMYVPPRSPSPTRSDKPEQIPTRNLFYGLSIHQAKQDTNASLFPTPTQARTYADAAALSTSAHNKSPILCLRNKKKNKVLNSPQRKNNARKVQNTSGENMVIADSSEPNSESDENYSTNSENKRQRLMTFKELIQRLKEVILNQNCDLMNKWKTGFSIIKDWVLAYIRKYISDFTIVKMFSSLFNG